jgi:hypothetical protein
MQSLRFSYVKYECFLRSLGLHAILADESTYHHKCTDTATLSEYLSGRSVPSDLSLGILSTRRSRRSCALVASGS